VASALERAVDSSSDRLRTVTSETGEGNSDNRPMESKGAGNALTEPEGPLQFKRNVFDSGVLGQEITGLGAGGRRNSVKQCLVEDLSSLGSSSSGLGVEGTGDEIGRVGHDSDGAGACKTGRAGDLDHDRLDENGLITGRLSLDADKLSDVEGDASVGPTGGEEGDGGGEGSDDLGAKVEISGDGSVEETVADGDGSTDNGRGRGISHNRNDSGHLGY